MITSLYPEYSWKAWKFLHVPTGWWNIKSNQQAFLLHFAQSHDIKNSEQWYHVCFFMYVVNLPKGIQIRNQGSRRISASRIIQWKASG